MKIQSKKKNANMNVKKSSKNRARASTKQKILPKKKIEKKTENEKKPKNSKTLLIAQEVKFARLLANNDKRVRDKVLKNLKKWLTVRSQSSFAFTEADFLRLWKGLFYCMWMSDKPLVQEDLAESLSKLVHCFNAMNTALLYTKCTLKSLAAEWFGIDRYRVDKFEMLVRKIIRQTFEMCKKQSWNREWVVGVAKVIEEILLDPKTCLGLNLHITDVYMEELAKISEGKIPKNMVTEFVRPFVIHLAGSNDQRQVKHIVKNIFRYLIFQSDVGMEYTDKFNVWREAGFPCTSIDEIEKVEVSDDEDEDNEGVEEEQDNLKEKPLDPRAGRVDVEIPQLPFDPVAIANVLKENKFNKTSTTMTRKHITRLINDFNKLNKGDMPFGIKELPVPEKTRVNAYKAAEDLINFDKELYSDSVRNNRKRKNNGAVDELDEDTNNVEELVPEQICVETPKIKKRKLVIEKENDETQEIKKKTKEKKSLKKKSKILNVSDPLPKKKKSSKKLNNTISECRTSAKDNINESSTSSNWNVDSAEVKPVVCTPMKSKNEKKVSKNVTSPTENSESKPDSSLNSPSISWLTPVLTRLEEQNKTPTPKKSLKGTPQTDSAKKRVKIMLQKNMSQNTTEYIRQIIKNPEIPFDANRKPKAGVLKPSPLPSPINPFYKKKIF